MLLLIIHALSIYFHYMLLSVLDLEQLIPVRVPRADASTLT